MFCSSHLLLRRSFLSLLSSSRNSDPGSLTYQLNYNGDYSSTQHTTRSLSSILFRLRTPNRGVPYTPQSSKSGTGQSRLYYILTRQVHQCLVRNTQVRRPSEEGHEPDHNLVVASICLMGRFAPNSTTQAGKGKRSIDQQLLMADHGLRLVGVRHHGQNPRTLTIKQIKVKELNGVRDLRANRTPTGLSAPSRFYPRSTSLIRCLLVNVSATSRCRVPAVKLVRGL